MNGDRPGLSLEDTQDEDIEVIVAICRRANPVTSQPTKSLYTSYQEVLAEERIDPDHDNIIYNWVLHIGERANASARNGGEVDFLRTFKDIAAAQGITLLEEDGDGIPVEKEFLQNDRRATQRKGGVKVDKRRVSFEEARYEETWLSEHTETLDASPPPKQGLLSYPPVRGRSINHRDQRARSADSNQSAIAGLPVRAQDHDASNSSLYASDPDGPADSSMLLRDPSGIPALDPGREAWLQDILHAFSATSDIRLQRRYIHIWHDAGIAKHERERQQLAFATNYDLRLLIGMALRDWSAKAQASRALRLEDENFARLEVRAAKLRSKVLASKALQHWQKWSVEKKDRNLQANSGFILLRYFRRWQRITAENSLKASSILTRKFLTSWQDRLARRLLEYEHANARHEEALQKRLFRSWYLRSRSQRVEAERHVQRNRDLFMRWAQETRQLLHMHQQAEVLRLRRLQRSAFGKLCQRLQKVQEAAAQAQALCQRKLEGRWFEALRIRGRLAPLEKMMTLRVTLTLQRKAFSIWHLHLDLTRQAAEVDRKRVLQDAWTSWNDALRCRALGQRIDERIIIETLYKWVLQERLRLFARAFNGRLVRKCFSTIRDTFLASSRSLEDRAVGFAERQRRRALASTMLRFNMVMRNREDAERAAVEFANSRALPDVLDVWKEKTEHARQLATWAADARFYCLCSSALKKWRDRTTEHQHERRRNAYIQVRARIKLRLVRGCFLQWRSKGIELYSMNGEANRRAETRLLTVSTQMFDYWRGQSQQRLAQTQQAAAIDTQRLLSSAISILLSRQAQISELVETAVAFRYETNLALLASALKRLQWANFTASQHNASATALLARNRDQHMKQMLRHWFAQATALRASRSQPTPEPDSPSLRPASRAAARSAERIGPIRDPTQTTPGYLQTPSRPRSRRATRFQPLPTPAPQTPFAFEPGYLATTPAPLAAVPIVSPAGAAIDTVGLTPQVTPFARKLRAGGFVGVPLSALRSSVFGRSVTGTAKSVRFARASRFAQTERVSEVGGEEDGAGRDGDEGNGEGKV